MKRSWAWAATFAAATLATADTAYAFSTEASGAGGARGSQQAPAPTPRTPDQNLTKPAPGQSGGYSFSGSSFDLSVTRTGHPAAQPKPAAAPAAAPAAPPAAAPTAQTPGLFRRILNWITGD